jgi:hypothetical protein
MHKSPHNLIITECQNIVKYLSYHRMGIHRIQKNWVGGFVIRGYSSQFSVSLEYQKHPQLGCNDIMTASLISQQGGLKFLY